MGRELDGDCDAQVRERPRTDNRGSRRIRTDDAGRAGRAVARRLQFAQQVVVLERRCRKEDGIGGQPDNCEPPSLETHVRPSYAPEARRSYLRGFSTRASMKNSIIRSAFTAPWPWSGPTCRSKLFPAR